MGHLFTGAVLVVGVVAIRLGINAIPNTPLPGVKQRSQNEIQAEALPKPCANTDPISSSEGHDIAIAITKAGVAGGIGAAAMWWRAILAVSPILDGAAPDGLGAR